MQFVVVPQISGNNGSWTNTDDHPKLDPRAHKEAKNKLYKKARDEAKRPEENKATLTALSPEELRALKAFRKAIAHKEAKKKQQARAVAQRLEVETKEDLVERDEKTEELAEFNNRALSEALLLAQDKFRHVPATVHTLSDVVEVANGRVHCRGVTYQAKDNVPTGDLLDLSFDEPEPVIRFGDFEPSAPPADTLSFPVGLRDLAPVLPDAVAIEVIPDAVLAFEERLRASRTAELTGIRSGVAFVSRWVANEAHMRLQAHRDDAARNRRGFHPRQPAVVPQLPAALLPDFAIAELFEEDDADYILPRPHRIMLLDGFRTAYRRVARWYGGRKVYEPEAYFYPGEEVPADYAPIGEWSPRPETPMYFDGAWHEYPIIPGGLVFNYRESLPVSDISVSAPPMFFRWTKDGPVLDHKKRFFRDPHTGKYDWSGLPPITVPEYPVDDVEDVLERAEPRFHVADYPNSRSVFPFDEEPDDFAEFDPLGSPVCGFVAISLALGLAKPKKPQEFVSFMNQHVHVTASELNVYAKVVGCNLIVTYGRERGRPQFFRNHSTYETVFLNLRDGHYYLMVKPFNNEAPHACEDFSDRRSSLFSRILAGVSLFCTFRYDRSVDFERQIQANTDVWKVATFESSFKVVDRQNLLSNNDTRTVAEQYNILRFQDKIMRITEKRKLRIFGKTVWHKTIATKDVSAVRYTSGVRAGEQIMCTIGTHAVDKANIVVFNDVTVNTPAVTQLLTDTCWLVQKRLRSIRDSPNPITPPRSMVQFNTSAYSCAKYDFSTIADNQYNGLRGGRIVDPDDDSKLINVPMNFVKKHGDHGVIKLDRPVGVAPVGTIMTDDGPVGMGAWPLTDKLTVLQAFAGRSMSVKPIKDEPIREFVTFAKNFLVKYIDSVDLFGLEEQDCCEAFRRHNAGKKSVRYVESIIKSYQDYKAGLKVSKSFHQHRCFVKAENSGKMVEVGEAVKKTGLKCFVKPRLIMVMSDRMLVECSPILDIFDRWNHGLFSQFQVKDMSPEEMTNKIIALCYNPHEVTDYSSFEASVGVRIREIELWAMDELCRRANYCNTAKAIKKHASGYRTMHSCGHQFRIQSRCSGDYWTSFGNGLVNVCLMAYCRYKQGLEPTPRMVAEGDDGLSMAGDASIGELERLGFKFSQSCPGFKPGDADFLRCRWLDGKKFLNIGRHLKSFWTRKSYNLKRSKQLMLLRSIGLSLYYQCPGHPVLTAIVNRIGRETRGHDGRFSGQERFEDRWSSGHVPPQSKYPRNVQVDETMRGPIASGATGFLPLPIPNQLWLEDVIENSPIMYIGNLFSECVEVATLVGAGLGDTLPQPNDFCRSLLAATQPEIEMTLNGRDVVPAYSATEQPQLRTLV